MDKSERMSPEVMERYIEMAYLKACPDDRRIAHLYVRWIAGGLISNMGSFIVTRIKDCKYTPLKDNDGRFTCTVEALMYPDFEKKATAEYHWKMTGRRYSGEYKNQKMP